MRTFMNIRFVLLNVVFKENPFGHLIQLFTILTLMYGMMFNVFCLHIRCSKIYLLLSLFKLISCLCQ
ncbi:hypothetical protein HanRHA438_Chr15g0694801 [Helianthus annuus]|nr:hypothetical protein HanRHA438_Chr15g0694801 [Helianthus annuus]